MRSPLLLRLAESLGPALLRLIGSTWRISVRHAAGPPPPGPVVFAFWHGRMLVPAYTHRGRGVSILVSRHRDGEIIARVVRRLGFHPIRGSTTRGGAAALRESLRRARTGRDLAFTPDGPRGPRYRVQPGVAWTASRTGRPILPGAVEAAPALVLGSWDEFTIPLPFARIEILVGAPIPVAPNAGAAEIEAAAADVEASLAALTRRAKARLETRGGPARYLPPRR